MTYDISIKKTAEKEVRRLGSKIQRQVIEKVKLLAYNPRPQDVKVLKGEKKEIYRVDSGEYRIIYQIDDNKKLIVVSRIKHRKDVYRNL